MKTKNTSIILFICLIVAAISIVFYKKISQQRAVATSEMRQVMGIMMTDFRQGSSISVRGVAANGEWTSRIFFESQPAARFSYTIAGKDNPRLYRQGPDGRFIADQIEDFKIRRFKEDPAVFEVNLKTHGLWPVTSHFKVRMSS